MTKREKGLSAVLVLAVATAVFFGVRYYHARSQLLFQEITKPSVNTTTATNVASSPSLPPNAEPSPSAFQESGNDINGTHIGYIKNLSTSGSQPDIAAQSKYSMSIDYVQWKTCTNCPDDYTVTNSNPTLRDFLISPDVVIRLQTYTQNPNGEFDWNQEVSLAQFAQIYYDPTQLYNAQSRLYWITLQNGVVTTITEQYQP